MRVVIKTLEQSQNALVVSAMLIYATAKKSTAAAAGGPTISLSLGACSRVVCVNDHHDPGTATKCRVAVFHHTNAAADAQLWRWSHY